MLSWFENLILVIVTVACSLLTMMLLNRIWPLTQRKAHNDLIGWQLGVLGTTYAVIIGFMLYTVWTDFGAATVNAQQEASQIVKLNRLAAGLPAEQREQMKKLTVKYANTVVNQEWEEMSLGQVATETNGISRKMWNTLMSIQSPTSTEMTTEDHSLYELSTLMACRQTRQLETTSKLPGILWFVLLIGGVLTIFSACLFGQESKVMHTIHVFSFSLLIALVLAAIGDIDRPYMGSVHVDDTAYRQALKDMLPQ